MKKTNKKTSKKSLVKQILLGEGILNWDRAERITDRYGSVFLQQNEHSEEIIELAKIKGFGTLKAKITEARPSYHIGDVDRGIDPNTPKVGQTITLGQGTLFREDYSVGVKPLKKRESDWLNPKALYRCHNQTVQLWFIPEKKPVTKK